MHRFIFTAMKTHYHLLLAGALIGGVIAGCDPKTIGDESAGNVVCQDGEMKEADDGCNTCTCQGGDWACTELACGECVDGEMMDAPDGCNTCSCQDGMWACTLIGCPSTDGVEGVCGDGIVEGWEECDDGNVMNGDGCSTNCTLEGGDTEGGSSTGGDTTTDGDTTSTTTGPVGVCGDGLIEGGEQCDDGNISDGDGCSANCTLEGGGGLICMQPIKVDPFEIQAAAIVGDSLEVTVQYGGGCETHDFTYCWDGLFLESFPVQVHTEIGHDGHNDPCDALPQEMRQFDLSELKKAYQDGYQTQNGEITIHLEGWGQSLAYVF